MLKGTGKYDNHCELQDSVNQQKVERIIFFETTTYPNDQTQFIRYWTKHKNPWSFCTKNARNILQLMIWVILWPPW